MSGWDDLPSGEVTDLGGDTKYTKVVDKAGTWIAINEWHLHPTTGHLCGGFVAFDVQSEWLTPGVDKWQVESWEPLTLSPSIECRACGHHGFIREGRWVNA